MWKQSRTHMGPLHLVFLHGSENGAIHWSIIIVPAVASIFASPFCRFYPWDSDIPKSHFWVVSPLDSFRTTAEIVIVHSPSNDWGPQVWPPKLPIKSWVETTQSRPPPLRLSASAVLRFQGRRRVAAKPGGRHQGQVLMWDENPPCGADYHPILRSYQPHSMVVCDETMLSGGTFSCLVAVPDSTKDVLDVPLDMVIFAGVSLWKNHPR